jgi:PleD family two-component response regulator
MDSLIQGRPGTSDADLDDLAPLVQDVEELVAHASDPGQLLATRLREIDRFEAIRVAVAAALAPQAGIREAIAEALSWKFALVGDDLILDHLAHDEVESVRSAAARAAWTRKLGDVTIGSTAPTRANLLVLVGEAALRAELASVLESAGFRVLVAESPDDLTRVLSTGPMIDLLVTDAELPREEAAPAWKQIPLLLLDETRGQREDIVEAAKLLLGTA